MKQYGYFNNKTYIITERNTPRHWYNYLYNDEYVTFVSQVGFGQGIAQDDIGRRHSPVTDRNIYIADGKKFRDCIYNVHFSGSGKVTSITVNGEKHDIKKAIAPIENGQLNIEVILG